MRALRVAVLATLVAAAWAAFGVAQAGATVTPSFSAQDVSTCTGSTPVTLTLNVQNPPPVQQAADIVLVMDASGSITQPVFDGQVRSSLESFVTWASPSVSGNHIAVVKFSTNTTNITSGLQSNATLINNAIATTPYDAALTYTNDALTMANAILSGPIARPTAPKIVIVETDGVWNPTTQNPSTTAHNMVTSGIKIYAVGVGQQVNSADLSVITDNVPNTVFNISSYSLLESRLEQALTDAEPAAQSAHYQVAATPNWTISGASASVGTITNATSGGFTWNAGVLNSPAPSTVTISYTETYVGSTNGANALASQADLSWVDTNGVTQSQSYASQTVNVSGCNHPPVAQIASVGPQVLNGSPTTAVHFDGSGSSDPDVGDTLTYAWTFDGGATNVTGADTATPSADFGRGAHTAHLVVSDGRLTASADVSFDVVDLSAPAITPHVIGTLGANGWYTSNVSVSFDVSEPESPDTLTTTGCDPQSVTSDTTGVTYTCSASSAGGDAAPVSVTIMRDATKPTITFTGNTTYSLGDTVSITCAAADPAPGSGLASSTCPGASGAAWTFVGGANTLHASATDNAGNTATKDFTFTVVVDAAGICSLIQQWSDNAGVANSLCVKIDKDNMTPFFNALAAQKGKHISAANADTIARLARGL